MQYNITHYKVAENILSSGDIQEVASYAWAVKESSQSTVTWKESLKKVKVKFGFRGGFQAED